MAALARLLDGDDDDAPPPEPAPPPPPAEPDAEPPPAKDDEPEPEGGDADNAGEEGADGIETVAQLAQMFGAEPAEVLSTLRIDLGADHGGEVTLEHLVDAYRSAPDMAPVQEVVTRYEKLADATTRESRAIFQQTISAAKALQELIQVDESEIEKARASGDSERALELITLNRTRQAAIDKAVGAMRQQEDFFKKQGDEDSEAYRSREFQSLLRKMPRWRDQKVGRAAMEQIQRAAVSLGFTEDEVQNLTDHRAIMLAWQASEYQRISAKVRGTGKKKVLALPKHIPPGTGRVPTKSEATKQQSKERMARLRRSGDERDAATLIEGLL